MVSFQKFLIPQGWSFDNKTNMIEITNTSLRVEKEPLASPFGFKGGFLTEIWQSIATMQTVNHHKGVGLGVQSVLWSDPRVFASNSEAYGNELMLAVTAHGLLEAKRSPFADPIKLLERTLESATEYGKLVTRQPDLRLTFILNALVAVDNAAWLVYAYENQLQGFDALIPEAMRPALAHRHKQVISIPAVGYGMSVSAIVKLVEEGYFVLKIKIGSDPQQDNDPEKMLAWDCARMEAIHLAVQDLSAPASPTGKVCYYLDANGRYDTKERVVRLLDFLEGIGALQRTILLEEPFPEPSRISVHDLPVRVVADESAHSVEDVEDRIALGYGAIALKPIAKTMSMTLQMAEAAHRAQVPCFCADLTVNPVLVDWNKNFAARLATLPGFEAGMMENNGFQNYRDWQAMMSKHPYGSADWTTAKAGVFHLDEAFYTLSGGILTPSSHYAETVD